VTSVVEQLGGLPVFDRLDGSFSLGDLLGVPGLVSVETVGVQPQPEEATGLSRLTERALDELVAMRRAEAVALEGQIRRDLGELVTFVDWFESQVPAFRNGAFERLRERLAELLGPGTTIDRDRQIQEAAILAERADVSEELVRLRSHLDGFGDRLDGGGPVGRTLDFMCQEILRELNTVGSKCRELGVAERLVNAKAALERVREQVQNLE
jgi:uncharacterized protein (TIGR00255 family)